MRRILITGALAAATPAAAENWVGYPDDLSGTAYLVDLDSVEDNGSYIAVWDKRDHSKDRSVAHRTTLLRVFIDCERGSLRADRAIELDKNGKPISDEYLEPGWYEPAPGSAGSILLEGMCE